MPSNAPDSCPGQQAALPRQVHIWRRVLGTDLACQIPNNLTLVVPCTHTNRNLPWQPTVTLGDDPGVAMCDQIEAVDRRRLRRQHPCGSITAPAEREAITRALRELIVVTG